MPSDGFAGRVRDAIGSRCHGMEQHCPEALDVVADAVVTLHELLHGRAAATRGNRPDSVFRRQLRGEDALTLEDLARLCIEAPTAAAPALSVLAQRAGYRLEPEDPIEQTVGQGSAAALESAATLHAGIARDLDDGVIDAVEAQARLADVASTKRRIAALETSLVRIARRRQR